MLLAACKVSLVLALGATVMALETMMSPSCPLVPLALVVMVTSVPALSAVWMVRVLT